MRNRFIILANLAIFASLAAAPTVAQAKASKEESVGVGAGAVIGAVAGGPVGFIIGASIGAKLGDTMHKKGTEIDTLSESLQDSRGELVVLEHEVRQLNGNIDSLSAELDRMQINSRPELVSLLQAGIAMDLLFRTDEHALADTTGSRLAELAGSLASMPDIRVQLDGFADERGDADYNYRLSEKRIEFVRDQLVDAGVDAARISLVAHGEVPAQDATTDSMALERRVSMTLFIDNAQSFASNPE